MKYIINERQYKLLVEEEQEILHIPSLEVFGDWEALQQFLDRRGNPLYSIGGELNLRGTDIESLGNLVSVDGELDLSYCNNLTSLGNLTSVGGSLYVYGCENLTSLGNLTSVGESLYLHDCQNITSLENLTSVGNHLNLHECENLTSLGNLTSVGRSLVLFKCNNLTSLGNLTSVGGDLYLRNTPISEKYSEEEIRDMVEIGGEIYL